MYWEVKIKKYRWWISRMDIDEQKIEIEITSCEVIIKAWSLNEELKKRSTNAHQKWCNKLLVRNNLTFRAGTHVGQELSENYQEKMWNS